jgi:GTP-binding protein
VLFATALKPDSVSALYPLINRAMNAFTVRVPTGPLNKFVQRLLEENPLPVGKGKPGKVTKSAFITQVATKPPAFALFVGHPEDVGKTYLRFLENRLREQYDFLGAPLHILVRKK